jgi:Diguanylate cyclase, GGDEF domain
MTGLVNRRHFLSLAEIEWDRYQRYRRPMSLLMLDIDRLKSINDRFGHDVATTLSCRSPRSAGTRTQVGRGRPLRRRGVFAVAAGNAIVASPRACRATSTADRNPRLVGCLARHNRHGQHRCRASNIDHGYNLRPHQGGSWLALPSRLPFGW